MTPITLSPYLNFGGKTREAIQFYQSVLGGTLTLQTFSEIPGMPVPPGMEDGMLLDRFGVQWMVNAVEN